MKPILTLFLLAATNLFAQRADWNGVLFNEAAYFDVASASLYNPQNQLLHLRNRSNVLAADINVNLRFTTWLRVQSTLQTRLESGRTHKAKPLLREVFVKLAPASALDLTFGRAILKWGTGYAFNPTGVIEPRRNPSDTSDRLRRFRGLDLAQADFYFRASALTLVYLNTLQTDGRWQFANDHRLALRASTRIRGFDVALIGFWEKRRRGKLGFNFTKVLGTALEIHGEFLGQRGTDAPQHLIAVAAAPDTLFRFPPFAPLHAQQRRLFGHYLAGFQYTFGGKVNLAMEYFHNDENLGGKNWRRFLDYLVFVNGQLSNPRWTTSQGNLAAANLLWATGVFSNTGAARDYLFLRLYSADLAATRISGELNILENLHDASAVVIPTLSVYLGHEISAYLRWSGFFGKHQSEFGGLLYRNVANIGMSWKF